MVLANGKSRSANRDEASQIETRARKWLARQAEGDWDLMVMGHVHHGFQIEAGPRQLASLPGWFDTLGYGPKYAATAAWLAGNSCRVASA